MFQSGIWILTALLMQTPSLDSASPKERLEAVDAMALVGRTQNVAPLTEALKKETKSDVRAAMVAGLGRIGGPEVIPVLTNSLQTDLDKDVRLQVVDSLQRLYIPVESQGTIKTVFNKVKSVFAFVLRAMNSVQPNHAFQRRQRLASVRRQTSDDLTAHAA